MGKKKKSKNKKAGKDVKFLKSNRFYILIGILILILAVAGVYFVKSKKEGRKPYFSLLKKVNKKLKKDKKKADNKSTSQKEKESQEKKDQDNKEKVHIVKKGEHLWKIAEKYYGSGYNAVDIAAFNKLKNPDLLFVGQRLIIPDVKPRKLTVGRTSEIRVEKKDKQISEYIVKRGDYLWKIALQVYGDGYAWVKIAKANKLKNPDLLYPGQKLIIP